MKHNWVEKCLHMPYFKQSPIGMISLECEGEFVTKLTLNAASPNPNLSDALPEIAVKAFLELDEYFEGKRKIFDIPLKPKGTDFMKRVWTNVLKIGYGKTASYKEIAILSGNSRAIRAVGMANNRNPIPIFIPCHRIIGSNGKLVGYGGGLEIKEYLLNLERSNYFKQ